MRVAFLSSEAVPYSKTGGLGDVSGALPKALVETGEADVSLITPLYGETKRDLLNAQPVFDNLDVEWLGRIRRRLRPCVNRRQLLDQTFATTLAA